MAPRSAVGGSCGIETTAPEAGRRDDLQTCSAAEETQSYFCPRCGEEKPVQYTETREMLCTCCGARIEGIKDK